MQGSPCMTGHSKGLLIASQKHSDPQHLLPSLITCWSRMTTISMPPYNPDMAPQTYFSSHVWKDPWKEIILRDPSSLYWSLKGWSKECVIICSIQVLYFILVHPTWNRLPNTWSFKGHMMPENLNLSDVSMQEELILKKNWCDVTKVQ